MNKIKKIAAFCVLLVFTLILGSTLSSCDKPPDIYTLVENILKNKNINGGRYSFTAELNIKINKDYQNDAVPGELNFEIYGEVWDSEANINIKLIRADGESYDFGMWVDKFENNLYVDVNDLSKIILELLYSTGFINLPVKTLFEKETESAYKIDAHNRHVYFDLTEFDLSFFDKYIKDIEKIFTVKSKVNYNFKLEGNSFGITEPADSLNFSDIKAKIDKGLLKLPGYRYVELYAVMGIDEDKSNFMQILAKRENGEREILEKIKLDCNLSKVLKDPKNLYSENIIPMRYLFELLGETVEWDAKNKQAYIIKNGNKIIFNGALVNSKTYINLVEIIIKTDYMLTSAAADDYVEFTIARKK